LYIAAHHVMANQEPRRVPPIAGTPSNRGHVEEIGPLPPREKLSGDHKHVRWYMVPGDHPSLVQRQKYLPATNYGAAIWWAPAHRKFPP